MKRWDKIFSGKFWLTFVVVLIASNSLIGQSLQHPHIWVTEADKQEILDNIENYEWASSFFNQLKTRIDSKKNTHKTNPASILNTIPSIPGVSGDRSPHTEMLTSASEAAVLYYLTNDEDYAQYAADILSHYNQRLSVQESRKYNGGTGLFFSDWWLESRALFPKIAIIYDLLYNYLNDPSNTVYNLKTSSRIPFDNSVAQTTVKLLADVDMKSIGAPHSNHSVLAGNGALFNVLMIDDDATRESYFNRFFYDPNNERFDAYQWTLANFTSQNIWDETFGYSKGSHVLVLQSLNVIDRYKPELDIINKNLRILDGYAYYENWFYPSGAVMRFGDTGTEEDLLDGYQRILKIADRKNLPDYFRKAQQTIKYIYDLQGGHKPKVETQSLEWSNPLHLLWGINIEDTVTATPTKYETTVPVVHAGLVIQRNFNTPDVVNNGLMYYSGGATYVHTHRTGIDLELYGKGLVLGAESGSSSYGTDEHENYRVRIAAHNTVIVNGSGKSGTTWDTRMSNVSLVASEPKSEAEPISTTFSFAAQFLNDTYNNCFQQRTNSIIRTSSTSGYYLDVFRSKSKSTTNYNDYIYHNIGDAVSLKFDDNSAVPLTASTKYASDASGSITGWKFFENVKSSSATNKAVNATFSLNTVNTYMNVFMPSGFNREYATALAPYTKGAENGYDKKKTPVMTIRQNGEAWDNAFVAVFEPATGTAKTVQSVENIEKDGKIVGAVVKSIVGGKEIKDIIISLDGDGAVELPEYFISFKGRFGIVRKEAQSENTETVTLYIGSGEKLSYANLELLGDADNKNVNTVYGVQKLTPDTRFTITTQVFGGGGTISLQPNQADYAAGSQVVVMANPEFGNVVDSWLGNAEGSASTDTITMFSDKNVFVRFRVGDFYTLNTSAEHGSVTQSEEGTDFIEQSCIDLTAVPDEGYVFDGWSGSLTSDENPLTVCFDANKNITANFKVATSIDKVFSESIIVSPNPSQGLFRVQVPLASLWSVYDISGKLIESGKADGDFELDLTDFRKSIYILNIFTAKGIAVKRIIIR